MVKNIILDVGKVLVAWEPEDAMKKLGFDDKTVKVVADATVNTPVWLETDRGVWSDEQILQAFYEKAPEYKKEIKEKIELLNEEQDHIDSKRESRVSMIIAVFGFVSIIAAALQILDYLSSGRGVMIG